jgi:hypothetical protein
VWRAEFAKTIHHVTEKFIVTTLVGTDGDGVRVFLDCGAHDVIDTAVVSQVNDFRTLGLDKTTHDIDGCIVTIKQGSCGNKTQGWLVGLAGLLKFALKISTLRRLILFKINAFWHCKNFNLD